MTWKLVWMHGAGGDLIFGCMGRVGRHKTGCNGDMDSRHDMRVCNWIMAGCAAQRCMIWIAFYMSDSLGHNLYWMHRSMSLYT
jgi:hypothetical protein